MVGNVYVQYREKEQAANALRNLTGRFYSGRPIIVDFFPVTDFREATCRQYEENTCNRGGYCNFMHLKKINSYYESQSTRHRSSSPHKRGRSGSLGSRRDRSPIMEGSEERRAKIEQWNREKEEAEQAAKTQTDTGNNNDGYHNKAAPYGEDLKRTMVTSSQYHNVRRDMDIDQLMTCNWQSS
ncbi:hypothetical protein BVRB_6g140700 [Beta vulgaris subsp. vulgaris]|nr:hypothetical protein BVRB_6g140700 [Beta vulgaris subsp. vulgaris]